MITKESMLNRQVSMKKIIDNHEAYVESLHLQKYFKIQPIKKSDHHEKKDSIIIKPKKIIDDKLQKDTPKERTRRTEDDIYDKFDKEMQEVISKFSNKIAIFFLFSQGILAGLCLANIFLLFEFQTLANFTSFYSLFAREIFDFIYFFTFISLVGNGVKFLNSYKRYSSVSGILGEQDEIAKLKKTIIYSFVILLLYISSFCLQMYLIKYIPILFYIKYQNATLNISALLSSSDFYTYASLSAAISSVSIMNFMVNIMDVERVDFATPESETNKANSHSYDLDDTRETTNMINI